MALHTTATNQAVLHEERDTEMMMVILKIRVPGYCMTCTQIVRLLS